MFSISTQKIHKLWIYFALFTLFLSACAAQSAPMAEYDKAAGVAQAPPAPEMEMPAAEPVSSDFGENRTISDASSQSTERIVIKNANMSLVVNDPSASMERIYKLAEEMGGFVVSANMYMQELESGNQVPRASITIRVPAEQLNEALSKIRSESDQDPLSESINSQDVTSEYVDLQSRLRNLEATEVQLTEIMEEARKTEDVLAVYNQLVQVREQIEVIKGQIKYYEESAALSSISVELLADEAVQPLTVGGWQPEGVAKAAIQALINALKFIANAIIWILLFIAPVLLVIYLVIFLPLTLVWRARRRRRAKTNETASEEPKETSQSDQ